MMNSNLLYACSHCFQRFIFEDLTSDNHYCKKCYETTLRHCYHCFKRFSPRDFGQNYCNVCKMRIHKYGKLTLCKFCKTRTTFGNQRCKTCYKKYKKLKQCSCCHMEFEKKTSQNGNTNLCWRCESTMQDPKSMKDSMENNSPESYSVFSSEPPLPPTRKPFAQIQSNNNKVTEDKDNNVTLKLSEQFTHDDERCDLANKINVLEKYLFQKDQELMGKDAEIILLKSECERIREIEEKMEILRKLDEENKEIEKKKKQKKKSYMLPSFKFFEGN